MKKKWKKQEKVFQIYYINININKKIKYSQDKFTIAQLDFNNLECRFTTRNTSRR